ncbi:MAG: class I SAM-dependent methyltransferase [Thermoplasmata archaeon]
MEKCNLIVDVGCENSPYLPSLSKKARVAIVLDNSRLLCKMVSDEGYPVVPADASCLPFKNGSVDVICASEVIVHLPTLGIFVEFERVCRRIVATVANSRSPHFKLGPTHIFRYTIRSLKRLLGTRKNRTYVIKGIGCHHVPLPGWTKCLSTGLTWFFPSLSPTIAIIGEIR